MLIQPVILQQHIKVWQEGRHDIELAGNSMCSNKRCTDKAVGSTSVTQDTCRMFIQ
ncbi:hypothetical protein HaLaN_03553, partial [Haematococcus lacustris]